MSFRLLCCTIDRESNKGSNMYTFYNDQPGISTLEWRIQQILTYRSRTNKIEFQDDSQIPLLHNSHWKQENVNLSIWRQHCNLPRQFQTHDHGFFEFVLLLQHYLLFKYWVLRDNTTDTTNTYIAFRTGTLFTTNTTGFAVYF